MTEFICGMTGLLPSSWRMMCVLDFRELNLGRGHFLLHREVGDFYMPHTVKALARSHRLTRAAIFHLFDVSFDADVFHPGFCLR